MLLCFFDPIPCSYPYFLLWNLLGSSCVLCFYFLQCLIEGLVQSAKSPQVHSEHSPDASPAGHYSYHLTCVAGGDCWECWHYLTLEQLDKNLATLSESSPSWRNRKREHGIKSLRTGCGMLRWDPVEVLPVVLELMLQHRAEVFVGRSKEEEIHLSVGGDENLFTSKRFSVNALSLSGLSTGNQSQSLSWLVICFCSGNKLETLASSLGELRIS